MNNQIDGDRRRFLGAAAMTMAAAQFGAIDAGSRFRRVEADRRRCPEHRIRRSRSHWRSSRGSAPRLALRHPQLRRGCPCACLGRLPGNHPVSARLRYDTLSFEQYIQKRSAVTLASDVIALMDALRIEKAVVAGCDWGARTANIVAALWPERCKATTRTGSSMAASVTTCRKKRLRPLRRL